MILDFVYFIPIILDFSINFFLRKDILKYVNNTQLLTVFHFTYQLVFFLLVVYIIFFDRKQMIGLEKNLMNIPSKLYFGLITMVFLMIWSSYSFAHLLNNHDVNYILPIFRGGSTILIALVGYYCYNESLTYKKFVAILLIIIGIYVMNYKNGGGNSKKNKKK